MPTQKKRKFAQDFSGESRTQQHFTDAVDVNNIVAHFMATGIDPHAERLKNQRFGFASGQDFSQAMQNIAEINSAFALQPSEIRAEFGNDPSRWLDEITPKTPIDEPVVETPPSEAVSDPVSDPNLAPKTPESEPK